MTTQMNQNQIDQTNPENTQPSNDDKKDVAKLSETVIVTKQISVKEENLAAKMGELLACEEAINEMHSNVTSSKSNLTPIARAKLRNDIRERKNEKKILKPQISKLSKELKKEYQKNAHVFTKKSLRISARKENYHKRYGNSIRTAITKMITAMEADNLDVLKSELTKLSEKDGSTLVMKALLKAPRHLHTKVVANEEARKNYLHHFRNELGITRKPSRGRRDN